jgi:hypothetical protein
MLFYLLSESESSVNNPLSVVWYVLNPFPQHVTDVFFVSGFTIAVVLQRERWTGLSCYRFVLSRPVALAEVLVPSFDG